MDNEHLGIEHMCQDNELVVEHDQKGSRLVTFVDLRTSRRFRNAASCDNEDCSRHMDQGDMKVQGPEQCRSDLVQGRHDLDCRDQGCRSTKANWTLLRRELL